MVLSASSGRCFSGNGQSASRQAALVFAGDADLRLEWKEESGLGLLDEFRRKQVKQYGLLYFQPRENAIADAIKKKL